MHTLTRNSDSGQQPLRVTFEMAFYIAKSRCPACGIDYPLIVEMEPAAAYWHQCARCHQRNVIQVIAEVDDVCHECKEALDDHDWSGDLAICIKGRAKR